eukprot:XP_001699534.1 protein in OXA1/oxaA family [Chlamydomonas reinhardtii]
MEAPRCLPCHDAGAGGRQVWAPESGKWGFPPGYPTRCDFPVFNGGSGAFISVGAFKKVGFEEALKCFYDDTQALTSKPQSLKAMAHGDRMVSLCFWMHGLAPTDPGLALAPGRQELHPGGRVLDSEAIKLRGLHQLLSGQAPPQTLWSYIYAASSHVRHSNISALVTRQVAALAPGARYRAQALLQARGEWGRGALDEQVERGAGGDEEDGGGG